MAQNPLLCADSRDVFSLLQGGRMERRPIDLYQRLLAINELAAALTAAEDCDQLQRCLAQAYSRWLPEASVCLCLIEGHHYMRMQISGHAASPGEGTYPLQHGLVGDSLRCGTPVFISDRLESRGPLSTVDEMACEYQARSLMVLPLLAGDRVLGCLEFTSCRPGQLTPLDYHLELLVAAHLSSALQNVLAKQQLAETNERLRVKERELTELNQRLQELALTDDLTGLHNKRRLLMQLDFEIARARRYGGALSCLMIDINDFKQVNDSYGHLAGDTVLNQMGFLLRRYCRATDFVARYGGDEFMVILPQTNAMGALRTAEKLRARTIEYGFLVENEIRLSLSISVGICGCVDPFALDAQGVIARADSALYEAKRAGGDRVCTVIDTGTPDERVKNLSNG
jgi:diguanylate cyclase (GGDEF)-like protein